MEYKEKNTNMDKREQIEQVEIELDELTDEERLDIFLEYCTSCGVKDPKCRCWDDE